MSSTEVKIYKNIIISDLTSYECGDGGAVIVPVHAVLQGTLLPDIAARSARKIDITNVAVEPPDDGRVE